MKHLQRLFLGLLFAISFAVNPLFAKDLDTLSDPLGIGNRDSFSSMPDEQIDPFTGRLLLTHTDANLPGNGGLDLTIQRTFNSNAMCAQASFLGASSWCSQIIGIDNWMSYGWTLHFGRVYSVDGYPVIEMQDGSKHKAYPVIPGNTDHWITKDYWKLDRSNTDYTFTLTLTDGKKIYFGQKYTTYQGFSRGDYATKIFDVKGNTIQIFYKDSSSTVISYVIDSVGRRLNFTTEEVYYSPRLTRITGPGIDIRYKHDKLQWDDSLMPLTFLMEAAPPLGNPFKYTYDSMNMDLTSMTTPYSATVKYEYAWSELTKEYILYRTLVKKIASGKVPAGTWTFAYNQGANKDYTQISDPNGRIIKYSYFGYGALLPWGSAWKFGLPISKETVGEELLTYEWQASNPYISPTACSAYHTLDYDVYVPWKTKETNKRDGRVYTTAYSLFDSYGNPKTTTETGDKKRTTNMTYWYNISNNIIHGKPSSKKVTGDFSGSFTTTNTYDTNTGNLLKSDLYGTATNFLYYANGNLKSETDANGNTTSHEWTNGMVSKTINPLYSISRVINSDGTIASETNGRNYTTSYTYDANLRLTSVKPPIGNTTTFSYTADREYTTQTRGSFATKYRYDGFARLINTSDSTGVNLSTVYKANGLKDYTTSNTGDIIYYDGFGRKTKVTHKDGKSLQLAYSLSKVTSTDEMGYKTTYAFNAFGNPDKKVLVSVTDPASKVTTYTYNILGNLLSIKQGSSITRSFSYDAKNYLVSESHPERGTISYTRDKVGNMLTMTQGGIQTVYGYDALYRPLHITSAGDWIDFAWDEANNRTLMTNGDSYGTAIVSSLYAYDALNRLVHKDNTIQDIPYATGYAYDGNNNIISITYPSGNIYDFTYNAANQVTSVSDSQALLSVNNVQYYTTGTPTSLLKSFTYSNGVATNLTYTARNLAKDIDCSPSVLDMVYAYNNAGDLTSSVDNLDPTKNTTFSYNKLEQLTGFNGPWGTGSYTYDALGNRLTESIGSTTNTYVYSNNRLSSITGGQTLGFTYNYAGDVQNKNAGSYTSTYQYDGFRNLTGIVSGTNPLFAYDGDGKRASKRPAGSSLQQFDYHYDGGGRLISQNDRQALSGTDYVYFGERLIAEVRWPNDSLPTQSTIAYYYHNDQKGTPLAMTDSTGAVVWRAYYKPFGNEYLVQGSINTDNRFVGSRKDTETGLNYFGARYMDTPLGRFTSPDPIGPVDPKTGKFNQKILSDPKRLNFYSYALNDPVNKIDPHGLSPGDIYLFTKTTGGYAGLIGFLSPGGPYGHAGIELEGGKFLTSDAGGTKIITLTSALNESKYDVYRPKRPPDLTALKNFATASITNNSEGYHWMGLVGGQGGYWPSDPQKPLVLKEYTCAEVVWWASLKSGNYLGFMGTQISPNEISHSPVLIKQPTSK